MNQNEVIAKMLNVDYISVFNNVIVLNNNNSPLPSRKFKPDQDKNDLVSTLRAIKKNKGKDPDIDKLIDKSIIEFIRHRPKQCYNTIAKIAKIYTDRYKN